MDGTPDIAGLVITPDILKSVRGIDEFKGAWLAIGRIAPERLSALRRVATIESAASSTRIEGAKLTDRAVDQLLSNLDIKDFTSRDEQEVAGYADAMKTVFTFWEAIDLTENHVRQLHRDLLKYSTKDERRRGEYKTLSNDVAAFDADGKNLGVVFATATPFSTPGQMAALIAWTAKALSEQTAHPLIIIAVFIVSLLAIHPVQILELCRERGHVTISDIVKASGASRNTVKDHVTALVRKAHLVRHGAGRGTRYALT